nr:hypothetical protein [Tanacetum cinerariifolium]
STAKIKPSITNERTSVKRGVLDVTKEESSKSEAESWGNDEDDSNNEQDSSESDHEENEEDKDDEEEVKDEFVKTSSNDSDDEDETKITDKFEGDEDEEMDYTTNQLYDDVDIRLNEPVDTNKGFVQEEGINAAMTNVQQGNENSEILQVIEDAHKSNKVKRLTKKSTKAPESGVVIRETLEMPLSKKKEKVDVTQGKGIELLSQVALTEDAQFKEVRRKSMRDFHKTHPSGFGTVTKTAPRDVGFLNFHAFLGGVTPVAKPREKSYSVNQIVIPGGVHPDLVSPGECLVLSKEVVNDNFGESRVVYLLLLFVGFVVNL